MTTGTNDAAATSPTPPANPAPPGGSAGSAADLDRSRLGVWVIAMGVGALVLAFVLVTVVWRSSDGTAALGVIATPIATIVGAYFGIQVTSATAKSAQDKADRAESVAEQAQKEKNAAVADAHLAFSRLKDADSDVAEQIRPRLSTIR
jgi:hypothetical protein